MSGRSTLWTPSTLLRRMGFIIAALVALVIIYVSGLTYLKFVMLYFMSYALLTISWDFIYSYSGQLSLGQALPFGLGGFMAIIMIGNLRMPVFLALVVAAIATAGVAGAIGATTIRLKPGYQGIALLLFSQVFYWYTYLAFGEEGYSVFSLASISQNTMYLVGISIFIPSMVCFRLLQHTKYRKQLLAIRGDNLAAQVSGINISFHKSITFVISSFFAGIAGSYFAIFTAHADYTLFALSNSFLPIGMAIVGGMGLVGGSILGAGIIVALLNILPIWFTLPITYIVYGTIVIVTLRFIPRGLAGIVLKRK